MGNEENVGGVAWNFKRVGRDKRPAKKWWGGSRAEEKCQKSHEVKCQQFCRGRNSCQSQECSVLWDCLIKKISVLFCVVRLVDQEKSFNLHIKCTRVPFRCGLGKGFSAPKKTGPRSCSGEMGNRARSSTQQGLTFLSQPFLSFNGRDNKRGNSPSDRPH